MNLLDAFKQYIKDAMPGGALNPEVSTQGVLDTAALATTPVPFLGDAIGLAADVKRLKDNPSERTPANFGLAALGALPFVPAGMFIGKGSKMWDALAAEKAQKMAAQGVDERKIFRETNTYRSPDGHWKQEISDHNIRPLGRTWGEGEDLKTGASTVTRRQRALAHPKLSAAYPDTKDIGVRMMPGESKSASYMSDPDGGLFDDIISLSVSPKYNYKADPSTMLHELQHAIQQREGWAKGGSPELFNQQDVAVKARDMLNWQREVAAQMKKNPSLDWKTAEAMAAKEYEAIGWPEAIPSAEIRKMAQNPLQYFESQPEDFVKLYGLDKRTTPYTPHEAYQRLAGEAEARATQARMNMNAAQRREVFPLDSYDVPIDQLIIRGLLD